MGEVGQSEGGRVKGIPDEESIGKVTEDDKQPGASGNIQQINIAEQRMQELKVEDLG